MSKKEATNAQLDLVYEWFVKNGPATIDEASSQLGFHYKTMARYISLLRDKDMMRYAGIIDRKTRFEAGKPSKIPSIPSANGPMHLMAFASFVMEQPVGFKTTIDEYCEQYPYIMMSLLMQGISFNPERSSALEKFLRTYRDILDLRMRAVNALLSEPKLWNPELATQFRDDPLWNETLVRNAWERANQPLVQKKREQFKEETARTTITS